MQPPETGGAQQSVVATGTGTAVSLNGVKVAVVRPDIDRPICPDRDDCPVKNCRPSRRT